MSKKKPFFNSFISCPKLFVFILSSQESFQIGSFKPKQNNSHELTEDVSEFATNYRRDGIDYVKNYIKHMEYELIKHTDYKTWII